MNQTRFLLLLSACVFFIYSSALLHGFSCRYNCATSLKTLPILMHIFIHIFVT